MLFQFHDCVTCDIHDYDNNYFIERGTVINDTNVSESEWQALLAGELIKCDLLGDNVYVSLSD